MRKKASILMLVLTASSVMAMAGDDRSEPADQAADARLRASFFECARPAISNLLVETENRVGRKMVFVAAPVSEPVAARCLYDVERHEPRIFLRPGWRDVEVAHEAMHMRLDLVEGFGMLAWRRDVKPTDAVLAAFGRVQTYVKDEVVHARLVKMGLKMDGEVFRPTLFDSVYRNATRYMEEGRDRPNDGMAHLDKLGYGVLCRVCFLVQAELLLKNYREKLSPGHGALAAMFIRTFRAQRPAESARADKILELFRKNDVQTPAGHDEILRAWAKMEDLDKFVGVTWYRKDQESHYTLPFPE